MRDEICKKSKVSWHKTLKKWFNVRNKAHDFHADDFNYGGSYEGWKNNISEKDVCTISKSRPTERSSKRTADCLQTSNIDHDIAQVRDVENYRIFVATWNVGGKSPTNSLNLEDWLHTSPPADIYVLGFQEIVPLNAGNVLGTEDNGPAKKWLALIRKTLNTLPITSNEFHAPSTIPNPLVELNSDFDASVNQKASSFHSLGQSMRMTKSELTMQDPKIEPRYSVCDQAMFGNRPSDYDQSVWSSDEDSGPHDSFNSTKDTQIPYCGSFSMEERDKHLESTNSKYCLVASKQMVGIYLTVWVKSDLRDDVHNMKVSCVGRGLMGYLGNKGSISISMLLHKTSFCFICSHLTSGQKEGDELRRNSDVMEIMKKTRFPRVQGTGDENSPQTILEHDRVIWLGDLNYRIALSYRSVKALLRIERRRGRVFSGWNEGMIYFPPTYKYSNNSDRYAGYDMHPREKRRTPAWCDRILWYGNGLHQLSYVRGESRFSDHRPVYSIFIAEVESINCNRHKKNITSYSSRIQVEELLPFSRRYRDLNFY
ncbi:endonuclease/exonuclease/phosphatase [Artemisia annua]|uniref:Endonuclease/exonuclease/phosphatase n=1 Tax=Artemisia annua TaxID=35608 RepID=A0A2U1NTT5_ARTAN|nr:endonuclease/exonuclease/phosphatase [Artemisia annua]